MKIRTLIIAILTVVTLSTNAQNNRSGMLDSGENSIGLATGIDYSILPIMLTYKRGISIRKLKYPIILGAEVTAPSFSFDLNDVRFRVISDATLLKRKNFELRGGINPVLVNLKMETEDMTSLGADFHIFSGITNKKWNLGLVVNYNKIFSTHIKHTEKYKKNVYAGAVDGWYKNTASNLRVGILANRTLGKINVYLDGGISKTGSWNNYLFVPTIYTILGVNYRF